MRAQKRLKIEFISWKKMGGWTLCYQIVLSKLARNQRVTIFFGDSWSFFGVCFHRLNGFAHWYLQFREGYHLWLKLPYMISDISVPTFRKLFVIIVVDTSIPTRKGSMAQLHWIGLSWPLTKYNPPVGSCAHPWPTTNPFGDRALPLPKLPTWDYRGYNGRWNMERAKETHRSI